MDAAHMTENRDVRQCLRFSLAGENYAIDILRSREVMRYREVTRVPKAMEALVGVINLRGNVIPVVDLRVKLDLPPVEDHQGSAIVMTEVYYKEEPVVIGALVDSVSSVAAIPEEDLKPPPEVGLDIDSSLVSGLWNQEQDDQFVILLDVDKIFGAQEVSAAMEQREALAEQGA